VALAFRPASEKLAKHKVVGSKPITRSSKSRINPNAQEKLVYSPLHIMFVRLSFYRGLFVAVRGIDRPRKGD
jgi:hypothetical protein